MCFGSGITCGTLAVGGLDHIDAVEIVPEVYEAAPLFSVDNLNVMSRGNVRFIVGDGRYFLKTAPSTYDFISFEPMPLAMAGVTSFYTEEYYRLCLARLKPGGMVSQWIPLHSLGNPVVARLFHTFVRVFPHTMVFHVNADLFLIGSTAPLKLDPGRAGDRIAALPELREALAAVDLADPAELAASCLVADPLASGTSILDAVEPPRLPFGAALTGLGGITRYLERSAILRDDYPWAEYEAPRWVTENTVPANLRWLENMITDQIDPYLVEPVDPDLRKRIEQRRRARRKDLEALRALYSGIAIDTRALDLFLNALTLDPNDPVAKRYIDQIVERQASLFAQWKDREKLETLRARLADLPAETPARQFVDQALATMEVPHNREQSSSQP